MLYVTSTSNLKAPPVFESTGIYRNTGIEIHNFI